MISIEFPHIGNPISFFNAIKFCFFNLIFVSKVNRFQTFQDCHNGRLSRVRANLSDRVFVNKHVFIVGFKNHIILSPSHFSGGLGGGARQ